MNKVVPLVLIVVLAVVAVFRLRGPDEQVRLEVFPSSTVVQRSSTLPPTSLADLPEVTLIDFDGRSPIGSTPATTTNTTSTSSSSSSTSESATSSSSSETTDTTNTVPTSESTETTKTTDTITITLPTPPSLPITILPPPTSGSNDPPGGEDD